MQQTGVHGAAHFCTVPFCSTRMGRTCTLHTLQKKIVPSRMNNSAAESKERKKKECAGNLNYLNSKVTECRTILLHTHS